MIRTNDDMGYEKKLNNEEVGDKQDGDRRESAKKQSPDEEGPQEKGVKEEDIKQQSITEGSQGSKRAKGFARVRAVSKTRPLRDSTLILKAGRSQGP